MQKVRGSNPLSSTDLSDFRSILKTLIKTLTSLGFFVALVCVVFVIVEDAVHHGRSAADLGHDHVAVDGFGDVGGFVAHSVADLLDRYAVAAHGRHGGVPSLMACQRPMPAFLVILEKRQLGWSDV